MSTAVQTTKDPRQPTAWWREPYVWLVIGGPLVVVAAAVVTIVIAVKNPDPVLDSKQITLSKLLEMADAEKAANERLANLQPAMVGRNHAAAPLPIEATSGK